MAADQVPMTFMTYNVANGLAPARRLVSLLRDSGADIIGLQELAATQSDAIAEDLRDIFPFQTLHPLGIPGKALLSRYAILDSELIQLQSGRPDLRAAVETPGGSMTIVVAHPTPPRFGRNRTDQNTARQDQITGLIKLLASHGPGVMLGDFNLSNRQRAYRQMVDSGLLDAFRLAGIGHGATLPTRFAKWGYGSNPIGRLPLMPVFRVDYVWHTPELRTLAAWRGRDAGSDHLPVFARLVFAEPRRNL
jgi:vancomycin resistance protein VanJ